MSNSPIDQVKAVATSYGVPEWIWHPIVDLESGGNPNSHAVTDREDSRGLFQINVQANPQYANLDLFDPTVNATVGIRDFILPAWNQVKDTAGSIGDKAAYVWKEGIRPAWTPAKDAAVRAKAVQYFDPGAVNNAGNAIGDAITNGVRRLFSWIPGMGDYTPVQQDPANNGGSSTPAGPPAPTPGQTPASGGDKVTVLKDNWLTPGFSFSKSGFLNGAVTFGLYALGAVFLFMFLKAITQSPAAIIKDGEA